MVLEGPRLGPEYLSEVDYFSAIAFWKQRTVFSRPQASLIESGLCVFILILPALFCCLISKAQRAWLLNYKGDEDILVSGFGLKMYGEAHSPLAVFAWLLCCRHSKHPFHDHTD